MTKKIPAKTQAQLEREKKLKDSRSKEAELMSTVDDLGNALDYAAEQLVGLVKAYFQASQTHDKAVRRRSPNYIGTNGRGKVASLLDSVVTVATTETRYGRDGEELPGPVLRRVSR